MDQWEGIFLSSGITEDRSLVVALLVRDLFGVCGVATLSIYWRKKNHETYENSLKIILIDKSLRYC